MDATQRYRPVIVAHRGLHDVHPENSLAAFRAAWDAGIEWCECDVQLSAAGEWVVIHDETLDRTTNCTGPVEERSDFRDCRLRHADGSITGESLTMLSDLLNAMPRSAGLLLEIKPNLMQLPELSHLRIEIQSFHRDVVREASKFYPFQAFLTGRAEDLNDLAHLPGTSLYVRHDLVDRDVVERCQHAAKRIGVWTVNAEPDIRRVIELGVDLIISDDPLRVRQMVYDAVSDQPT